MIDEKNTQYIWRENIIHFDGMRHEKIWGKGGSARVNSDGTLKDGSIQGGIIGTMFKAQKWNIIL